MDSSTTGQGLYDEENKRKIAECTAVLKALGAWPVNEPAPVEICHYEQSMDGIMGYFVKNFKTPEGREITRYKWFWNPTTDRVMFELTVTNKS